MAQRISRAKQSIKAAGATFRLPPDDERAERLRVVLQVLYLVFNEGYSTSSGDDLQRTDLTAEAIRLARLLHAALPDDGEATGLLALMLLTDARRDERTRADGALVTLDEQDRSRWDRALIDEGVALLSGVLGRTPLGPYQLQAAIAAVHDEAPTAAETDWAQIIELYDLLVRVAPNPVASLNRVVAVAEVHGPETGLELLGELDADDRIAAHHRTYAVRAHLLERVGDITGARAAYLEAARRTTSRPEQRHLESRAARLTTS